MVQISNTTTENSRVVTELTENVGILTKKISDVDSKVDGVRTDMENRINATEGRNMIDIRDIIKRVIVDFLIAGGSFGVLYYIFLNGVVK